MIPEWMVIATAILIVFAFAIGVIVGVKMGLDIAYRKDDDDFHV